MDLHQEEIDWVRKYFDLDEILEFQAEHDIQIIRMEDFQYICCIDKQNYGVSLTPMMALVKGIKNYKNGKI